LTDQRRDPELDAKEFIGISDQMREDWNARAKKDAYFYVAFACPEQAEEDFWASAAAILPAFERELPRLPCALPQARRALEIGCGPGRLMLPMSRYFGELYGVDVSEEMVALARERLGHINAHVYVTSGSDLVIFANEYFDFVYSYLVFQHIPDREIVLNYLRESRRVLKPGGVLRCQIRGTEPPPSEMVRESETWTGCFFSASEMARFAMDQSFPMVDLSGLNTQYMWATFRKPIIAAPSFFPEPVTVKDVTAASGPGTCVPNRGRGAFVSLWIKGMPEQAGLEDFRVLFGEREQIGCYLSPVSESGACQVNVRLPDEMVPGEYCVQLKSESMTVEGAHPILVLASPVFTPRVLSVTDGINLSWANRVVNTQRQGNHRGCA
jgi:SAM-dependent methyltransferase